MVLVPKSAGAGKLYPFSIRFYSSEIQNQRLAYAKPAVIIRKTEIKA